MKKNDILRVRIDIGTLTALKRACEDSGCNLSDIVRQSIARELARRDGNSATRLARLGEFEGSISRDGNGGRGACAQLLSSVLVSQPPRSRGGALRLERKQREVSKLLDALFRALDVPLEYGGLTMNHCPTHGTEFASNGHLATGCSLDDCDCAGGRDDAAGIVD
jgi:hypothetical protein